MNVCRGILILALLVGLLSLTAYDGHADPAQEQQHYSTMSDGCDLGYQHSPGQLALFVAGTCTQTDRDLMGACARALPAFTADDLTPYWDDLMACPAGQNGSDRFYQDLYRAYVLSLQGQ